MTPKFLWAKPVLKKNIKMQNPNCATLQGPELLFSDLQEFFSFIANLLHLLNLVSINRMTRSRTRARKQNPATQSAFRGFWVAQQRMHPPFTGTSRVKIQRSSSPSLLSKGVRCINLFIYSLCIAC